MSQDKGYVEKMRRLSGLKGERFLEAYRARRLDYDSGSLDSAAYWKEVLKSGGVSDDRIAKLNGTFVAEMTELDVRSWTVIRKQMIEWARRVKEAGFKTAILSNMPEDHAIYLKNTFDWLDLFDVKVFSYAMRLVKPQPAIYAECLRRLGVEARAALFIDDLEPNVEAARSTGLHAIHFENTRAFVKAVRAYPELPLPRG